MSRIRCLALAGIAGSMLILAPFAAGQYTQTPLTISSGFNQDIVIEATAVDDTAGGTRYNAFGTASLDGGATKTGFTLYESGLPGTSHGLPAGGSFTSVSDPSTTGKLAPYNANNALLLEAGATSGTLTLAAPQKLDRLAIFATTGSGSNNGATVVVHFADATPDLTQKYNASDWFGGANAALGSGGTGLGRLTYGAGLDDNADNPRVYQTNLDLTDVSSHPVASLTFSFGGNGHTVVMGMSGHAAVAQRKILPIAATGYNQDIVIERTAVNDATNHYQANGTATLDDGTAKGNGNFTFYEKGLAGTSNGLPSGNRQFLSHADPNTVGALQPYDANNAILLTGANTTGTLTLTSPAAYKSLAIFAATGNGNDLNAPLTIHFTDGTPDLALTYNAPDWFNGANNALGGESLGGGTSLGLGRLSYDGNLQDFGNNPRLYQTTLDLSGVSTHPIRSIDFGYGGAGNSVIMGISGEAVPEPSSIALVIASGLTLLARRRRGVH